MTPGTKGIVLAGVHHWRNSVLERVVPRPLVPIGDRRLIGHVLSWLGDGGVRQVSVCANSDTEVLRHHLAHCAPNSVSLDFYEDHMPRGPAGCVRDASLNSESDTLVVVDATIIPHSVDLARMVQAHAESGAAMTVAVVDRDRGAGRDATGLEPIGIYVLDRRALNYVAAGGYQDIKETLIPKLYEVGERVVPYFVEQPCPRVAGADSCLAAAAWVLGRGAGEARPMAGYRMIGDAQVHETAQIGANTRLIGPVLIGKDSRIGEGAAVVGPTTIGVGCRIGESAVISRSAVWDGSTVGKEAFVDRCIVTYGTVIAARAQHYNTVFSAPADESEGLLAGWMGRSG